MNIILGSGITALILLELKPDYVMMSQSESIGGQSRTEFPLGPRILHHSPKVAKFLERIGIVSEPKMFKPLYIEDGEYVSSLSERAKIKYFNKTRGNSNCNESFLNGGLKEFLGYDIGEIQLVETLIKRNSDRIEEWKFSKIDLAACRIYGKIGMSVGFEHLINTMDLEQLSVIVGEGKKSNDFLSRCKKNITFTLASRKPRGRFGEAKLKTGEFIYLATDEVINRATAISDEQIVLESTEPIHEAWYEKNGLEYIKSITTKSQI